MEKFRRTLKSLCLLCITGAGGLYAQQNAQQNAEQKVEQTLQDSQQGMEQENPWKKHSRESRNDSAKLAITPSICVIKQKGDTCRQTLTLLFRSKKRHNICIYHSFSEQAVWCDNQVKEATLELTVKADKDIKLTAKNSDNNDTLATATFALSVFQPVKKRKRRHYGIGIL